MLKEYFELNDILPTFAKYHKNNNQKEIYRCKYVCLKRKKAEDQELSIRNNKLRQKKTKRGNKLKVEIKIRVTNSLHRI